MTLRSVPPAQPFRPKFDAASPRGRTSNRFFPPHTASPRDSRPLTDLPSLKMSLSLRKSLQPRELRTAIPADIGDDGGQIAIAVEHILIADDLLAIAPCRFDDGAIPVRRPLFVGKVREARVAFFAAERLCRRRADEHQWREILPCLMQLPRRLS